MQVAVPPYWRARSSSPGCRHDRPRGGVRGPLAMAAVPALVVPLKLWTDRQGPLTQATGYFPSGHTTTAMVAYGAAALLLARHLRRTWATLVAAVLLTRGDERRSGAARLPLAAGRGGRPRA